MKRKTVTMLAALTLVIVSVVVFTTFIVAPFVARLLTATSAALD